MNIPVSIDIPNLDKLSVGRVGENLVAFYLESVGFECSIVDRRGSDVWCKSPSGKLFSIEIKSTLKQDSMNGIKAYCIQKKEADQFILTCLETNLMRVFSREKLMEKSKSKMVYLKDEEFTVDLMRDDIERLQSYYS